MEIKSILAIAFFITFFLFGIGCLWFWIWCIIDCCKRENDDQNKLVWLLTLYLFTFLGAFLYFFFRRPERLKEKEDYSLPVNKKAITSLIIGICGFWIFGIGIITNIIGIVLGHIARREIRKGKCRGNSFALAGLFICYLPYVLILLIFVIGLPLAIIFGEKG